jgi:hypothetical protein
MIQRRRSGGVIMRMRRYRVVEVVVVYRISCAWVALVAATAIIIERLVS